MSNITFHWKNFRDNAGVEKASRLILLFVYQALRFPDKKIKNTEFAQQFETYKSNFKRLIDYKIFERSSLWEKYGDFLNQYFEDEKSEYEKDKFLEIKNSFNFDFASSIEIHKKKFRDDAETFISWGAFFLIFAIVVFAIGAAVKKRKVNFSDLYPVLSIFFIGVIFCINGIWNLLALKSKKKIIKNIDNEFCFEKLNDELDLVSSYFTEEAKQRQIIDLRLNYHFKKLAAASKEFEFLIIHGIEENFFIYGNNCLSCVTANFPKYVLPDFLQCEDFYKDYKSTMNPPAPFYIEMKSNLDSLFGGIDTKRCGKNNSTDAKSAWDPNGKDLKNRLMKALEKYRKSGL